MSQKMRRASDLGEKVAGQGGGGLPSWAHSGLQSFSELWDSGALWAGDAR